MFDNESDRGQPSALKGWLSDIYYPALVDLSAGEKAVEALTQRLGTKATIDDPFFGRASGFPDVKGLLEKSAAWLASHKASFLRTSFTTGIDRDVTEGTLTLTIDGSAIDLPVAVVAERRRAREVELRIYFSTHPLTGKRTVRAPLVAAPTGSGERDVVLPQVVSDHVDALEKGDVMAALACFEADGVVRGARGEVHAKGDGLKDFYIALFAGGALGSGVGMQRAASADDGRSCALEYTLTKVSGRDVPPQAGLMVYERGDSGLLRAIRVYDDVES